MARDTLLAGETQMVPLTAEEEKAYTNPDSTLTLETAFRPTGPLARFMRIEAEGEGRSVESPGPEGHSGPLSGLSPKLYYDRVDGLGAGLTLSRQITRRLRLELSGDYRTGLKRWGGTAALQYEGSGRSALRGDFNLFTESALRQDSFNYPRIFNSLAVLIGAADYYDYYWREGFSLRIGRGFHPGLPVRLTLGINAETHSSLAKTTDWSLFKRDIVFRDNPAVAAGRIRALTATLELGEELPPWGIVGARHVEVQLEHSSPDFLSSDFDYTTIRLILDGRLSTFLRRRFLPNVLDFRLVAGTSYGSPPLQKLCSMDTRLGLFAPFGTFRTLANRPLEGDRYLGIFWEHNFRTVPFELLGLRKLARMGYSIILHGASGRTWMEQDAALAGSVFTLRDWHHEVGISLSGILDFLRLDVTTEIGGKGLFFSFGMARLF